MLSSESTVPFQQLEDIEAPKPNLLARAWRAVKKRPILAGGLLGAAASAAAVTSVAALVPDAFNLLLQIGAYSFSITSVAVTFSVGMTGIVALCRRGGEAGVLLGSILTIADVALGGYVGNQAFQLAMNICPPFGVAFAGLLSMPIGGALAAGGTALARSILSSNASVEHATEQQTVEDEQPVQAHILTVTDNPSPSSQYQVKQLLGIQNAETSTIIVDTQNDLVLDSEKLSLTNSKQITPSIVTENNSALSSPRRASR